MRNESKYECECQRTREKIDEERDRREWRVVENGAQRLYKPIHTALGSLYASRAPRIMQLDDV